MIETDFQAVNNEIVSCLRELKSIGVVIPNKGKTSTFHNKIRRWSEDEYSDVLSALFEAARVARERGYPIPKELSYFMIDYFTVRFEKDRYGAPRDEPIEFKRAFAFDRNTREEPIRDLIRFQMDFDDITDGYLKGARDLVSNEEIEKADQTAHLKIFDSKIKKMCGYVCFFHMLNITRKTNQKNLSS